MNNQQLSIPQTISNIKIPDNDNSLNQTSKNQHQKNISEPSLNISKNNSYFSIKKERARDKRTIKTLLQKNPSYFNSKSQQFKSKEQNKISNALKGNQIYQDVKIIRKVSTFISNLKQRAHIQIPNFGPIQQMYLQNQKIDNDEEQYLLSWQNPGTKIFSIIFLFVTIGILWSNTYELVVGKQDDFIYFKGLALIFNIIWVLIKLNSQLKTKLHVIKKRKQVFYYYLKSDLIFESLAILCLLLQLTDVEPLFYPSRIIFLVSTYTYNKLMQKLQNQYSQSVQLERIIIIFKLVLKILIILHFLSLFFILISYIEDSLKIGNDWLKVYTSQNSSQFDKYITGYYWAATTMSTVGYGDIVPTNNFQKAILSFVQVFCCLFFGYCVNIIGNTIQLIRQSNQKYDKQSRKLNRYLKTLDISNDTKNEIKQYIYNRHKIQHAYDQQNEKQIINVMNQNLRKQISQENNSKIIQRSRFLKKFSLQTKCRLAQLMKKKIYAPNQILFNQNTENITIYLIDTGKVNQFCIFSDEKSQKPIAKYDKQDNTIGYFNILTGKKYQTTARADNYVFLYEIGRNQFLQVVKKNQNDYFIMNEVRQKILQNKSHFKKGCFVCERLSHNVIQCPRIHLIPKPAGVLFQIQKFIKVNNKRFQSYKRNSKIRINIFQFVKNNQKLKSENQLNVSFDQNQEQSKSLNSEISYLYADSSLKNNQSFKRLESFKKDTEDRDKENSKDKDKLKLQKTYEKCLKDLNYDKVMLEKETGFFINHNLNKILKKINKSMEDSYNQQDKNTDKQFYSKLQMSNKKGKKSKKKDKYKITTLEQKANDEQIKQNQKI